MEEITPRSATRWIKYYPSGTIHTSC